MPQRFLIIDGYNLLHAAGMARYRYGPGELEKARNRLLHFLANRLSASERLRTTIVFDAGDAPYESSRRSGLEGMTVLFAKRGGDADTVIERLIEVHSAPRQIHLVSSDHRLQKAARKRRARSVDSEDYFADLESRNVRIDRMGEPEAPKRVNDPKFTGDVPETETDMLLEIFADAEKIDIGNVETDQKPAAEADSAATKPSADSSQLGEEEKEKVADIKDAEWQKYLAEFPEDLNELLNENDER